MTVAVLDAKDVINSAGEMPCENREQQGDRDPHCATQDHPGRWMQVTSRDG